MAKIRIFLDTDVIISSLLSNRGAGFQILQKTNVEKYISMAIKKEIFEVAKRFKIHVATENLFKKMHIISVGSPKKLILSKYKKYVFDEEDAHVVAGAHVSKARYLLSYNIKHYDREKIKNELNIILLKPGYFLQFLRLLGY